MLLWMGVGEVEGEGEGEGNFGRRGWMRREERFVSDLWFFWFFWFFLLDDVLTFGKKGRGIEDVWVWLERDGHSVDLSKRT